MMAFCVLWDSMLKYLGFSEEMIQTYIMISTAEYHSGFSLPS